MRTQNIIYLFIILFFFACQPNENVEVIIEREEVDLYVSGKIKDAGETTFKDFRINFNEVDEDFGPKFWNGDISEGELGTTYILGNYASEIYQTRPIFGLQFWSEDLPDNRMWTPEELENFFNPGTTFEFGQGFGKVEVLLSMPVERPTDYRASRPTYLEEQEGSLEVISISDYDYQAYGAGLDRHSYGKLIRCTFSGLIGRYDNEADQADGNPNIFITDEIIELKDCELVFYVEYERI